MKSYRRFPELGLITAIFLNIYVDKQDELSAF